MTEEKKKKASIHELKLHEYLLIEDLRVIRVPGGWVYESRASTEAVVSTSMTFVPYHEEFKERETLKLKK